MKRFGPRTSRCDLCSMVILFSGGHWICGSIGAWNKPRHNQKPHLSGYEELILGRGTRTVPLNQTCSRKAFADALSFLQEHRLLAEWVPQGIDAIDPRIRRYDELILSGRSCLHDLDEWPPSAKGLVIDLGEGTTGTRWLHQIVRELGYRSMHNVQVGHDHPNQCYSRNLRDKHQSGETRCTTIYENFDFVSDSPVAYQVYNLVMAFPRANFVLSIRDGEEWRQSRLKHHTDAKHWVAASPCGIGPEMSSPEAGIEEEVLAVWITCFVPRNRLFIFNLFSDHSKEESNETSTQVVSAITDMLTALRS